MTTTWTRLAAVAALILLPGQAAAHAVEGSAEGFVSGVLHPVLGFDHLVAMVAVGLWGAQLGTPLLIALPGAFPVMMAIGGLMGMMGVTFQGLEIAVAGSAVALGLAVLTGWRARIAVAITLVGSFAIFHGIAHGQELPHAALPIAYGAGFLLATGTLHLAGIAIGMLQNRPPQGPWAVRGAGAAVAVVGAVFLAQTAGVA